MNTSYYITACRICQNKKLTPFFDLGLHPLANSLIKDLNKKEKFFPLCLCWCSVCKVVQLNYTVAPKILFSNYFWITGTSQVAKDFSFKFYQKLVKRSGNSFKDFVLEIASNDGTFLKPFIENGYRVIGVDPAKNVVEIAKKNNIPTICGFWGKNFAIKFKKKYGSAQIIFARNVLAHVSNVRDFIEGAIYCLSDDGILAVETHYAGNILDGLHYDSIYHEHLFYFTLKSLEGLFNKFNLFIFDVESSPISGGGVIVYAKKKKEVMSNNFKKYKDYELKNKINDLLNWERFAEYAFKHKKELINLIKNVSNKENNLIGWGASARSSTLLNFCKIDSKIIPVIADQNFLKHKHFTAGSHILIDSPDLVMKRNPNLVIILAWNFTKEIINILKNKYKYSGKYIIPLPNKPKIQLK